MGPTDIIRTEHETNVFIPCNTVGLYLPFWKISGLVYDLFSLPNAYLAQPPHGLMINVVTQQMNGTTFQCYHSGRNGFGIKESSVGVITVLSAP